MIDPDQAYTVGERETAFHFDESLRSEWIQVHQSWHVMTHFGSSIAKPSAVFSPFPRPLVCKLCYGA
jgi:hypothetical protein